MGDGDPLTTCRDIVVDLAAANSSHPVRCQTRPMATTTPDVQDAPVKAGVPEDAASEITRRLERRGSPSSMSILIGATLAGFGLLAVGIGWVKSAVGQIRTEIHVSRSLVEANRDRIDAVNARVGENTERLIRIETLLEERLSERR